MNTDIQIGSTVTHQEFDDTKFHVAKLVKGWYHIVDEMDEEHVVKARYKDLLLDDSMDDDDDEEQEQEQEHSSKMASALAKARPHYTKSKASSGKSSLHNGDSLATMLAGCEPDEVAMLADLVCEVAHGTHYSKYSHLNQGQIRMNSGNKIRGRIKREEILESTVVEVAKANLATLMAVVLDDKIIIRTEFISALDQDVDFTEASWARELETRKSIREAQDEHIKSLGE